MDYRREEGGSGEQSADGGPGPESPRCGAGRRSVGPPLEETGVH